MIDIEAALKAHDAEIMVMQELLAALVASHPNAQRVLANFQERTEALARYAPPDTDPEQIIEVLARSKQNLIVLKAAIAANEAKQPHRP